MRRWRQAGPYLHRPLFTAALHGSPANRLEHADKTGKPGLRSLFSLLA